MSEKVGLTLKKPENRGKEPVSKKTKADLSHPGPMASPVEQILHLQRTIGNRAVTRLIQSGALQAKLKIGNSLSEQVTPSLQRKEKQEDKEEEKLRTSPLNHKKTLKVGVYSTLLDIIDPKDAVKEPIAIPANSIEDAADKLEKKKSSENASIETLSFYGHGSPGHQSVGAGRARDVPEKEISSESIDLCKKDYKRMFGTLTNGATIYLRGCNVGARQIGLDLLKKIKAFCSGQSGVNVEAVAWAGKAYQYWFHWINWWRQTGEKITSETKAPKVTWEDHEALGRLLSEHKNDKKF